MRPIFDLVNSLRRFLFPAQWLFKLYLKYFPIPWHGASMYMGSENSGLAFQMITGVYETYTNEIVKKYVREGDIVCDVGAHIGDHTTLFSKLVGKSGKVVSIEPSLNNFKLLEKNIEYNNFDNVQPLRIAISDKKGRVKLYLSDDSTDNRLGVKGEDRRIETVVAKSLDDLFANGNIDFIKIDVQGWEIPCLKGMTKLATKKKKFGMIIEFWPKGIAEAGMRAEDLFELLNKYKFQVYYLDEKNKRKKKVTSYKKLIGIAQDEGYVNLLCLKK